jgi:lysozyme
MIDLAKLRADLERDEGRRRTVYRDTMGVDTIGVGRNIRDKGVSDAEIDLMLNNDIADAQRLLDRICPWWQNLPEPAARGLANLAFDLDHHILDFRKMLAALQDGNGVEAAAQVMNSAFARQTGARAFRIAQLYREAFPPTEVA